MRRRSWLKLLLAAALAVSTMAVIGSAAGAQEGRDGSTEPGPAVESPDAGGGGGIVESGDWDGDGPAPRDQQILDDLIVDGSLCVGFDCVNGESFGFDTLRLKENNIRIHFQDTSTSASFPPRDWRIVINDTTNGGASYFAVEDTDAARQPFRISADSQAWAIYTTGSRVGLGTNSPVVELHVVDGDTPTLRLEQDGSSGFTQQTWDVAGNEANFFVRDVTNGSRLVLRIRPGAPTSSLDIQADGDVAIGRETVTDEAQVHIKSDGTNRGALRLERAGNVGIVFDDTTDAEVWSMGTTSGTNHFTFSRTGGAGTLLEITDTGELLVNGTQINVPDYVFADAYRLRSIAELAAYIDAEGHLPGVTSAEEVAAAGQIDIVGMQMQMLEKIEELTLYTIQQQAIIDDLSAQLAALQN